MFKLPYNCTYFTCQQGYAPNPSTQASAICELKTFQYKLDFEEAEDQEIKFPALVESWRKQGSSTSALLTTTKAFDFDHNKLWKILKETGIPDHLTYLVRNLYGGQEATVRTGHD